MICIYASNTTDFDNNGLGVLDKYIKAEVEEEINGDYTLKLIYPISEKKSKHFQKGNIIKAPVPKGEDYFIIKKKRRTTTNVEVLCVQISDELSRNGLTDVRPTDMNGHNALNWMKDRLQYPTRFSFSSNITKIATAYYIRKNFLDSIMGNDENSFINVWGGELDRNKFNFNILSQLGSNRGFRIENGKNLINIEETTEGVEVTRIMPTGRDENDTVIQLPEGFIDSPLINNYPTPSIKYIDFPNIKVSREDAETEFATKEAVYAELRRQVNLMYTVDNVDRAAINFSVDFLDRRNIKEVKELGILQQLYLGDIVTIHSKKLDIDIEARLRKYTWDCAKKKYTKLELGDYTKSQYSANQILNNKIIEFQSTNYEITNKIKQALGGHTITREGEFLVMDTDDIATATKLWRWNLNGLAYGDEGYNGNYKVAITMDGEIVANFIKTGELDASLIKVGLLQSVNKKTWINMENGTFNLADKLKFDGTTFSVNIGSKTAEQYVQDSVNSIQVGSQNLIKNSTGDYGDMTYWEGNLDPSMYVTDGFNSRKAVRNYRVDYTGSTRQVISQVVSLGATVKLGDTFTISAWVFVALGTPFEGTLPTTIHTRFTVASGLKDFVTITIPTTIEKGKWVYFSQTGSVTDANGIGNILTLQFALGTNGDVRMSNLKVERGNKATDWSPHPDDITREIQTNVSSLTVGGRNLLSDSSFERGEAVLFSVNSGSINFNYDNSFIGTRSLKVISISSTSSSGVAVLCSNLVVGQKYTASALVKGEASERLDLRVINESNWNTVSSIAFSTVSGTWVKVSITFTANEAKQRISVLTPTAKVSTFYLDCVKVELGDKATDWTPAIEDVSNSNLEQNSIVYIDGSKDRLFPFDSNLCSTAGDNPTGYDKVSLRYNEGYFGSAVAVEESTINHIETIFQGSQDWTKWNSWNNATYWATSSQYDDPTMGKVFKATGANVTYSYLYKYSVFPVAGSTITALSVGDNYSISLYCKCKTATTNTLVRGYLSSNSPSTHDIGWQDKTISFKTNEWVRLEFNLQVTEEVTVGNQAGLGIRFQNVQNLEFEFAMPQLEKKPFCTSFIKGSRTSAGYLAYGNILDYITTSEFSILARVKSSGGGFGESTASNWAMLFNVSPTFYIGWNATDKSLYVSLIDSAGVQTFSQVTQSMFRFNRDTWYLIGVTFKNGTLKVYIDNKLVLTKGSIAYPLKPKLDSAISSIWSSLKIGWYLGSDGVSVTYPANLLIDEFFISKRELTLAQISALVSVNKPLIDPQPKVNVPNPSGVTITIL